MHKRDEEDADRHYEQRRDDLLMRQLAWVDKVMEELLAEGCFPTAASYAIANRNMRKVLLRNAPKVLP